MRHQTPSVVRPLCWPRLSMTTMSPGLERRHQHLLDIGPETHAINWAVNDAGRAMRPCRCVARKVIVRQGESRPVSR
jgi:hypothetical protein